MIDRSNENADNSSQHFWEKKIKLCGPFPLNFCELASSEPSLKSCVALKVAVGIQWSGRPQIHRQVRHSGRSGRSDATATLWLEVSFTSKSNGRPCHYANEFETAFQLFQKFSRKSLGESKNPWKNPLWNQRIFTRILKNLRIHERIPSKLAFPAGILVRIKESYKNP